MFKGRMNRTLYWFGVALIVALYAALRFFDQKASVSEVVLAFICIPRLHDFGRTGWYFLLPIGVEIAAVVGMFVFHETGLSLAIGGLMFIVFIVVVGLIPGQQMSNRFGDQPRPWLGSWRGQPPSP